MVSCLTHLDGATMSDLATIGTYSVFIASYVVFALGKLPGLKIDRPGAAIIGAVLMFSMGAVRAQNALHLIHFGTVVLLFSMMVVVGYLHLAGFFDLITHLVQEACQVQVAHHNHRSEEHTSELQSHFKFVFPLLL